jgi:formylglycine-generating enzyme required for sulfatase activity
MDCLDVNQGRQKMKRTICLVSLIAPVTAWMLGCGNNQNNPAGPNNTLPNGMVSVPAGTFQMGSTNGYSNELPVHSVTVSAFYIDTTEVTQADYLALMGLNPATYTGDMRRPVESNTWFDAVLYCNARSKRDNLDTVYSYTSVAGTPGDGCTDLGTLAIDLAKNGYRLPTEAEWEYACRAGSTTDYYWGKNSPLTTAADTAAIDSNAVWYNNSMDSTVFLRKPARVATKLPNAWGLYDMSGNVWEWCNDWLGSYSAGNQTDPTGAATGSDRICRGGQWNSDGNILCSAIRGHGVPVARGGGGLRCVRR